MADLAHGGTQPCINVVVSYERKAADIVQILTAINGGGFMHFAVACAADIHKPRTVGIAGGGSMRTRTQSEIITLLLLPCRCAAGIRNQQALGYGSAHAARSPVNSCC
jgi:hypothetical protein